MPSNRYSRLTVLCALVAGLCVTGRLHAEDAKAVVAWLESRGSYLEMNERGEVHSVILSEISIQGDRVVQVKWSDADVLRLKPLKSLKRISISGTMFSADGLAKLGELPALEELNIMGPMDGNPAKKFKEGVGQIKGLKSLQVIGCPITTLEPLAGLSKLETLFITGEHFDDANFKAVAGLKSLKSLQLPSSRITDLRPLAGLAKLEVIDVGGAPITDAGAAPIADLKTLKELTLTGSKITDKGFRIVAGLSELTKLVVSGTAITDLSPLAKLTKLKHLGLSRTGIDDADMKHLAGMTDMTFIFLRGTDISDISVLRGMPRLMGIYLENTKIDDADLVHLMGLKDEEGEIMVGHGTKVSPQGVERLQKKYPKKHVN